MKLLLLGISIGLLAGLLGSASAAPRQGPLALNISGPVSMTTLTATDAEASINIDCCTQVKTNTTLAKAILTGTLKTDPVALADKMTGLEQALLDTKTPLSSCADDPACQVDPKRCDEFWQVINGTTYLIGRNIIVTISWNGDRYQMALRNPC